MVKIRHIKCGRVTRDKDDKIREGGKRHTGRDRGLWSLKFRQDVASRRGRGRFAQVLCVVTGSLQ